MAEKLRRTEIPLPPLFEGEQLISIAEVPDVASRKMPSSLREFQRLARSPDSISVGDYGPVLASLAVNETQTDPSKHLFEAVFGRDALRTAMDLLDRYPKLARSTLLYLAEFQGTEHDLRREEEPGRIAHEVRDPILDPVAQQLTKNRGWGWPYYGSVDATPEFVRTLSAYCQSSQEGHAFLQQTYIGRDHTLHTMADALDAAVGWIEKRMDANAQGVLEFHAAFSGAIENQAWKDSPDAYFHADGAIASHEHGIASVEVQRVAYDALLDAAELYETHLELPERAQVLRARAEKLRTIILERFWTEDKGGYFVLGTDRDNAGNLRQLKIRTSNMGHLLKSRLLAGNDPDIIRKREAVIRQLFSPEMLGLNGIRTLAMDEARYRPGAYHNGSVWIWDTHIISLGLSQLGYHTLAHILNEKLLEDIRATRRFPEYLRGDDDPKYRINRLMVVARDHRNNFVNTIEQPPQDIQAWSVAAVLKIKIRRGKGDRQNTTDPHKIALEEEVIGRILNLTGPASKFYHRLIALQIRLGHLLGREFVDD